MIYSKLSTYILIGKILIHELTLRLKGYKKEENKKKIALKATQEDSKDESPKDSSEEDEELSMLRRGFKKYLKKEKC